MKKKILHFLPSIFLCLAVFFASSQETYAAWRSTTIQGYYCDHSYICNATSVFGSTSATYSSGAGFPTITCRVTVKGTYSDGTQTAEASAYDTSGGNTTEAYCSIGSSTLTFISGESKAYFMGSLWSTY